MALSAARNTLQKGDQAINSVETYPVAATKKIYQGALVVLNATGFAEPATAATAKKAVGRAEALADNTTGADGAISIVVRSGTFKYLNSAAGDAIAKTEVGKPCFAVDDQTVAKTDGTGTRSVAGIVEQVDTDGVWVEVRPSLAGIASVDQGGTGANSLTAHSLVLAQGTAPMTALGAATDGQLPFGQTGADPALHAIAGDVAVDKLGASVIGANAVTGAKINEASLFHKTIATGLAAPGAVTFNGVKVGDKLLSAIDITNFADVTADFEATITVINQIQQTAAVDLHLAHIIFLVLAKS